MRACTVAGRGRGRGVTRFVTPDVGYEKGKTAEKYR